MDNTNRFATRSLLVTLLFNAILLAVLFVLGGRGLQEQWFSAVLAGVVVTLGLWLTLRQVARPLTEPAPTREDVAPPPEEAERQPEPAPLPEPEHPYEASAVQMLSILQRKGRLIDFLQEDIQEYGDAQIGAAVRNVHERCREALREVIDLEPVFSESEGDRVTVETGFDPQAVRLTGQVTGDPPFQGQLQHRGWRVTRIDLPKKLKADEARVVAPAEVEV